MSKRLSILGAVLVAFVLTGAGCIQLGGGGGGAMGVYQSTDKGDSWQPLHNYMTAQGLKNLAGLKIYRIHDDPTDPKAMYVATRGQGLFYTYDAGASWQSVDAMNGKFIYGLAVDPKDKCTMYVSDGPHIFKTSDCARTWNITYTEERPSQRFVSVAVDYGNSNIVYGALINGDVIRSKDAGRSWQVIKRFGYDLQYLTADPQQAGRIYLASYRNGLVRSDDLGDSWVELNYGLDKYTDSHIFYRIVLNPGKKDSLFWISRYGILQSDDAGMSWSEIKLLTPPGSVNIYGFAINPKNQKEMYYTGTILGDKNVHVRSTFYRSGDGGKSWVTKKLPTNTIPTYMMLNDANPNIMYLGFTVLDS